MDLKDQYKYFVSAYYGIREMDEYDLKVYVLKDVENFIKYGFNFQFNKNKV